jgi:hypothetical protein
MTKTPGEFEPPKPITKAERDARKAFRQVDAETAMTEHEIARRTAAAIRRSRSRGRPLRPVVPTHPPGKLADALRPTGSSTVRIF